MARGKDDFLKDIETAIVRVVGPKTITPQSFLRGDLDVQSIDLVEIFFELHRLSGLDGLATALFAVSREEGFGSDISVGQLLDVLAAKEATLNG